MSVETSIRVHQAWYPHSALDDASARFTEFCTVEKRVTGEFVDLVFSLAPEAPPETIDEFLNYALLSAIESFAARA